MPRVTKATNKKEAKSSGKASTSASEVVSKN